MYASQESPSPLEVARGLFTRIRALGPSIERERRVPRELITRMAEAGLFRLCVPRVAGGLEAEPKTTLEVIEELSRADGSVGWCLMIGAASGILAGYVDAPVGRRIYANSSDILGGVAAPVGTAEVVEGGYRATGRWSFASGCQHSSWLVGGCVLNENGAPMIRNGAQVSRLMTFPISSVRIHETWEVSGLCATGSHDMEVEDVFVPRELSVSLTEDRPVHPGPLYTFPPISLLALGVAAAMLGMARAAVDEYIRLASEKVQLNARQPLAHRPTTQVRVSEAEATLRSARAFLFDSVDRCWQLARAGERASVSHRAELRLACTHAATSAARAVDLAYNGGGGTSIYDKSPLQRFFRDIHTATQHAMVSPDIYEVTGKVLLGLEKEAPRL